MFDVLYFPIWWYSAGLKKRLRFFIDGTKQWSRYLAIKILVTHIFKPMFGQYNWEGRIISFFMRLIQLMVSFIIFIIGFIFILLILILWIVLPVLTVWQIINLIFN